MKRLSCPKLIVHIFLYPLVLCLFVLVISVTLLKKEQIGLFLVCLSIGYSFFVLVELLLYRNVFCRIVVDKEGLANKYVRFPWSETLNYRIIELKIGLLPVFFRADFFCVGDISSDLLITLNPHKTVFFSLDAKTIEVIRSFAGEKSPV